MAESKGSINMYIENYVKELKGKNRRTHLKRHKNAFIKALAIATGLKERKRFGFLKNPKLLREFNRRLKKEKENECMIEKQEDCTKGENINRCYWNPIPKVNPRTGRLLLNGNIGCKKTTLSDNLPMPALRHFKGDAIYTPNELRDTRVNTDHLRLNQEQHQYLIDDAAEKGVIAMEYAKKYDRERAERKRAKEFWEAESKLEGGRRKTRRKKRKKRKSRKRKKRKTRRKQKGGSNINFKQKLLIKIKENKTELKNLFNNSMKRYYRGKKVIKFEDLINIVENMDEKKLIMAAQKIGKLIKEKDNTKKLGKNLRGGNPEVLFIFLGINSICAIFALLFYIMYNLVFPDEVASLYLYIAGGHEGIRNRHPNLTDEQIRTRIEEKSKEFQAFLAFTNFIACMLGAFSLITQIADEPPQRSYNHIFDFSRMLEDSGQEI